MKKNAPYPHHPAPDKKLAAYPHEIRSPHGTVSEANLFDGRPATPEEVSYRNGYVQGRSQTQNNRAARQQEQRFNQRRGVYTGQNDSVARGLLLGIALASFVAVAMGAVLLFDRLGDRPLSPRDPSNAAVVNQGM